MPAPSGRGLSAQIGLFCRTALSYARRPGRRQIRRVRARKLRHRRWRCVMGAADRRRRNHRPRRCQLRAGELCAVRGNALLLICSGAANCRDCLMGVQLGSKVIWAGFPGCDRGAGTAGQQPEPVAMLPDEQASSCGRRLSRTVACDSIPARHPCRFRRPGTWNGRRAGAAACISPVKRRPAGPCCVRL